MPRPNESHNNPRQRLRPSARLVFIAAICWTIVAILAGAVGEGVAQASRARNHWGLVVPIIRFDGGYHVAADFAEVADLALLWRPPSRKHAFGWFPVASCDGGSSIILNEVSPTLDQIDIEAVRLVAASWVLTSSPSHFPKDTRSIVRSSPETHRVLWLGLFLNGSIAMLIALLGLALLTSPFVILAILRRLRRRRRLHRHLCPHCAYDLSATPSPVCPECGDANPFTTP